MLYDHMNSYICLDQINTRFDRVWAFLISGHQSEIKRTEIMAVAPAKA